MGLDNSYNKFYVQEVWLDFFFNFTLNILI